VAKLICILIRRSLHLCMCAVAAFAWILVRLQTIGLLMFSNFNNANWLTYIGDADVM